jgi:4-diphosphocytidyl-2-C-methyl-D-erythritol kinase
MNVGYKCTLALDVLGSDREGYHQVDLVLLRLPDGDEMAVERSVRTRIEITGMPDTEDNLVRRAVGLMQKTVGAASPVAVSLKKRVPIGAGLGGGSADAGALLRWAMAEWPARGQELAARAASLGADVPFFVTAWAAARGTGRGDQLEPLPGPRSGGLVVAWPGFPVSTAQVYLAYDKVGSDQAAQAAAVAGALARGAVPDRLGNQLELAAAAVEPRLRAFRTALMRAGAPDARTTLSGSGSAYVMWCESMDEARQLGDRIRGVSAWVRVVSLGTEGERD